ncbi:MAG: lysine 2,3-aminomutase [Deltaproteobacteria bacterium RIFOXYD12_FULL_57_12]|nr:MAG: lysine 2,3-aminomutase [Deltaproteobacteria bacterium RIFOXYD12_FULL_57_12]
MKHWQQLLQASLSHPEELAARFKIDPAPLVAVAAAYPMRINPYYLNLIRRPGDPLWCQAVPDVRELTDRICQPDPLNEEQLSPVPNLVHKYPDRALFLVNDQCAMYCRFCTRKRKVGTKRMIITSDTIKAGLDYLGRTPEIRDVLLSGGDPLLLEDEKLQWLLESLRRIPSIEIIRIGSRVPCTLPMRITTRLAALLKRYHPLYINTHFNHPDEITPAAALACQRLAAAGIPLGCQTVLLRGINDDPLIMKTLFHQLLRIRVRPYYLFQGDMTKGTDHFRTPIEKGLAIMRSLIGHTSGLAVPTFAVDAPGGGGKIPLTPNYVRQMGDELVFNNYCGMTCTYGNVK